MKLPDTIEEDLIELLNPSISDGTLKNRRNLLVSSFTIISVYIVGKSITDLRIFGLNLEGVDSNKLLLVAIAIIIFWLLMYVLHAWRDKKIVQARRREFDNRIELVKKNIDKTKKLHLDDPADQTFKNAYSSAVNVVEQYNVYQKRLKTARLLTIITFTIEYALPALLSLTALFFLMADFIHLINGLA